jgi:hypothetical protein
MSQSDYIKLKKTSAVLNKNNFPQLLIQSSYLDNKGYYLENKENDHITFNQLKSPSITKIYGMEVVTETYTNCVKNSKSLICYPKSNYKPQSVIGNQYNPTVKTGSLSGSNVGEPKCIYMDDGLYCNNNKVLKPITYLNNIHYINYKKIKDEGKFNSNIRNERIEFIPHN